MIQLTLRKLFVMTLLGCCLILSGVAHTAEGVVVEESNTSAQASVTQLGDEEFRPLLAELEHAREQVYPALVNISVVAQRFRGGRAQRSPGAGSGVIISPDGHVITNYHVSSNATRITCRLSTGESFDAEVIAHDPLTDLSVLKIHPGDREEPLPYATFGNSNALKVGDFVLAMGNPLALSSSMTLGIISNTQRVFTDPTGTDIQDLELGAGQRTGVFTPWIQHDALILPGNSGGPLVNLQGEIIGINTRGGGGVGFASPSSMAERVYREVLEHGEVPRAWLDVRVLPTEKLDVKEGVLIGWVVPGSAADQSGLKAGDVLLAINGVALNARYVEEIPDVYRIVSEQPINSTVEVRFKRDGKKRSTTAKLERMEPHLGEQMEVREFGLTVRDITGPMALSQQLQTDEAVYVTGVRAGFPFEEARPRALRGDLIVSLDGEPTRSIKEFREVGRRVMDRESVPVRIIRNQEEIVTVIDTTRSERIRGGGRLPRAWLGLRTQVLTTPVGRALDIEGTRGFRVTEVYDRTEAAKAGFKVGDILTAVDEISLEAYRSQDAQELRRLIEEFPIGDEVEIAVLRDGEKHSISVVLEATPPEARDLDHHEQEELEFTVREITFMDGVEHRWPAGTEGVLVTDVTTGGWAHIDGLRADDLIVRVSDETVADLDAFIDVMDSVIAEKPRIVTLHLYRGHRTHFVFVEPDWEMLLLNVEDDGDNREQDTGDSD